MRALKFYEEPEDELTPEQQRVMKVIVIVVIVSFIVLLIGLLCLMVAYAKCNCNAV